MNGAGCSPLAIVARPVSGMTSRTANGLLHSSSNTMPGPETGIGTRSSEAFSLAMRKDTDRKRGHPNPESPHECIAPVTDDGLASLCACPGSPPLLYSGLTGPAGCASLTESDRQWRSGTCIVATSRFRITLDHRKAGRWINSSTAWSDRLRTTLTACKAGRSVCFHYLAHPAIRFTGGLRVFARSCRRSVVFYPLLKRRKLGRLVRHHDLPLVLAKSVKRALAWPVVVAEKSSGRTIPVHCNSPLAPVSPGSRAVHDGIHEEQCISCL